MSQAKWAPPTIQHRKSLSERFWEKVNTSMKCWFWQGHISRLGYGKFMGRHAHRVAWELTNGFIPASLDVCHSCDNPACVNPQHLFLGTASDNIKDCVNKGRLNHRGENNSNAKLTRTLVEQIRKINLPQRKLASLFHVSKGTIYYIQKGISWQN